MLLQIYNSPTQIQVGLLQINDSIFQLFIPPLRQGTHGDHEGDVGGGKWEFERGAQGDEQTSEDEVYGGANHVESGTFWQFGICGIEALIDPTCELPCYLFVWNLCVLPRSRANLSRPLSLLPSPLRQWFLTLGKPRCNLAAAFPNPYPCIRSPAPHLPNPWGTLPQSVPAFPNPWGAGNGTKTTTIRSNNRVFAHFYSICHKIVTML